MLQVVEPVITHRGVCSPSFNTICAAPLAFLTSSSSRAALVPLEFWTRTLPSVPPEPLLETCRLKFGDAVPMPTLPLALMLRLLVGAPALIRKGRLELFVTSLMNSSVWLAPRSQVLGERLP